MIRPEKHMSLKYCLLNVSAEILSQLRGLLSLPIDELEVMVSEKLGTESEANFVRALTLLYAIGILDFDIESDMIYLVQKGT